MRGRRVTKRTVFVRVLGLISQNSLGRGCVCISVVLWHTPNLLPTAKLAMTQTRPEMRISSVVLLFTALLFSTAKADGLIGGLIGGDVGRALDRAHERIGNPLDVPGRVLREGTVETAGPALAQAIRHSRDDARRAGVRPIPGHIYRDLRRCFSSSLLQSIQYRVGQGHELSVQANSFRFGDATAVALIDTIVFRHSSDARNNIWLWAHEVKHIDQYRRWGLSDFAKRYVRNHRSVEREADAAADRCVANLRSATTRPQTEPGHNRNLGPRGPAMAVARFCSTRLVMCQMGMAVPVGSSCYCPSQFGPVWGIAR